MHVVLNMVVRNEERRIGPMLAMTLPLVDQAIIVDQQSDDLTATICKQFGCTVIEDIRHGYCEPSRRLAWDASPDGSWILILDADEFVMPQFSREMRDMEPSYVGANLRFSHWVGGEHLGDGDPHYRFSRKENMALPESLHSAPMPTRCTADQIYCPTYPAILHAKSWQEQLAGEIAYEEVLMHMSFPNHTHLLRASTRNLRLAEAKGLNGNDLDQMSIPERHQNQFGLWNP